LKKKASKYLRLIGIFVFIAILYEINIKRACLLIQNINIEIYCFALLLVIPVFIISAFRWFYFLKFQNINYPFLSALLVNQTSQFIAFVSPGRIGEMIKVWYLMKDTKVSFIKGSVSVFIPRFMDASILLICCISFFSMISIEKRLILVAGIVICSLFLMFFFKIAAKDKRMIIANDDNPVIKNIKKLFHETCLIIRFKLILFLLITLFLYLFFFYFCYYLAESIGLNLDFSVVLFVVSAGNILSFLPFSIAGIGTRDASYIFILSQLGKSYEEAIIFSNLVFLSFYLFGGTIGFISYMIKPIEIGKIHK